MPRLMRYPLQALNFSLFMLLVWYFSAAPPYRLLMPGQAVVTVAFAHAGERREPCRSLSAEELAALPPNMRTPMECPRERSPVSVDLLIDGEPVIDETLTAPGLYNDLGVDFYRSATVRAGEHRLVIHMNDNTRVEGPTHVHEETVTLRPAQRLVINFNSDTGKFFIR
ncbi:MAG: hypothetical protein RQ736_00675 [Thiogranum sp.]|nr:hypothetical protein [Thiogranum sp.]